MSITIYHNPRCSKSRATLQLIEASGVSADVVTYLENPPSAERIRELATLLGLPVSDLLRKNEDVFRNAEDVPALDDDAALAGWIASHPKALQRPIVVDDDKHMAIVGRPPENVNELLSS
jgi:arsenate reductase